MKTVAIIDTETSTLDPATGRLIEVAVGVYSVEHASLVRARSWLIAGEQNEAVAINGIKPALLRHGVPFDNVMHQVHSIATKECPVFVAHNATFDRKWFTPEIQVMPWIDSCDAVEWPRASTSRSLAAVALAHGVGVVHAHRALADVMTLAAIFDRCAELGHDVAAMLVRAMRPRKTFRACVSYDDRELAKQAGFRWDQASKMWLRDLVPEDVPGMKLSFPVEVAS